MAFGDKKCFLIAIILAELSMKYSLCISSIPSFFTQIFKYLLWRHCLDPGNRGNKQECLTLMSSQGTNYYNLVWEWLFSVKREHMVTLET